MAGLLMDIQCLSLEAEFWEMSVFEVNNQHILVTGGSSRFGLHFARFLASNGARVTLAARRGVALKMACCGSNATSTRERHEQHATIC